MTWRAASTPATPAGGVPRWNGGPGSRGQIPVSAFRWGGRVSTPDATYRRSRSGHSDASRLPQPTDTDNTQGSPRTMNIFRRLAAAAARWRANATWKPDCAACYHYGVAVAHTEEDGNDLANRGDTYQAMAHYAEANRVREAWHEHRVADHTPADA